MTALRAFLTIVLVFCGGTVLWLTGGLIWWLRNEYRWWKVIREVRRAR